MSKPLKLKVNKTVPDGIMIAMWKDQLQKVIVAGRDQPVFTDLKPGTVLWVNQDTKQKLDAAMGDRKNVH